MLFIPTDYKGTKCHHFFMIEIIQTQIVKHCIVMPDLIAYSEYQ